MKQKISVLKNLNNSHIRAVLVPVSRLADIKNEIIKFREKEELNDFQKYIVYERYILDLPALSFKPESILVAAAKYKFIYVKFIWQGKTATDIFRLPENENEIPDIIRNHGFLSSEEIFWLPQKRIAVQSGLAEYGRNNIVYVPDWGSFFGIYTYITDIPLSENHVWRDAVCMDICNSCGSCIRDCPTGAISKDRFLIDNEICIPRIVEMEQPLPEGVPSNAIHSLNGCLRCQLECVPNKMILESIKDEIIFDEYETNLMLEGVLRENLPHETQEKLNSFNMRDWNYKGIPRNLKIMLDNAVD